VPGRVFASPADFNAQFYEWLGRGQQPGGADAASRPADLIEADRAAMLPLPAIPPKPAGAIRCPFPGISTVNVTNSPPTSDEQHARPAVKHVSWKHDVLCTAP
jgi:hypothetical protein